MAAKAVKREGPSTLQGGYRDVAYLLSLDRTFIGSGAKGKVYQVTITTRGGKETHDVALKIISPDHFTVKRPKIPFLNNMLKKTNASLWPCVQLGAGSIKPYFGVGKIEDPLPGHYDLVDVVVCVMGIRHAVNFHRHPINKVEYADAITLLAKTCLENNVYVLDFKKSNLGLGAGADGKHRLCLLDIDAVLYPENIFLNRDETLYYEMECVGNKRGLIRPVGIKYKKDVQLTVDNVKGLKGGDMVSAYRLSSCKYPHASRENNVTVTRVAGNCVFATVDIVDPRYVLMQSVHGNGRDLNLNEATKKQLALITPFAMLNECMHGTNLFVNSRNMDPGKVLALMIKQVEEYWEIWKSDRIPEEHLKWLHDTFIELATAPPPTDDFSLLSSFNDRALIPEAGGKAPTCTSSSLW